MPRPAVRRQRDDELAESSSARVTSTPSSTAGSRTDVRRLPHDPQPSPSANETRRRTGFEPAPAGTARRRPCGALSTLELPTLLVVGTTDVRFTAIAEAMVHAAPNAVLALVAGAGHAAHAEQPALTSRIIGSCCADPH